MKISIDFELPEDERLCQIYVNAEKLHDALCALETALRQEMKYKTENTGEHYMELFYEILNKEGVRLD